MPKFGTHLESYVFPEECYIFTWTILNFSSLNASLESPKLSLFPDFQCSCQVYSNYCFQCVFSSSSKFHCVLTLNDASYSILLQKTMETKQDLSGLYSYSYTLYNSESLYEKLKHLPMDTLVLAYKLSMRRDHETQPVSSMKVGALTPARFLKTLSTKIGSLPDDFLNQKITLCVDKETLTVNKSVLCASSPVFAKMFETGMREEIQNSVAIQDISMAVLKILINFLYTGIVPDGYVGFLCDLYYAADKYDITELRDGCRKLFRIKMTVRDVPRLLKLASVHGDDRLKSCVVAFLGLHLNSVLESSGWWEMMHNDARVALEAITAFCP